MHKHPEDHEMAERAWARLLYLRAQPPGEAAVMLRQLADTISLDSGPALESDRKIRTMRSGAWLAVCAVLKQLETAPDAPEIDGLWIAANDAAKGWQLAAE